MSILVTCSCGSQQRLPNSYAGKEVKCLKCGKMVGLHTGAPALIERRLSVGSVTLVTRCQESQAQQADAVLRKVASNQNVGVGLGDKVKLQIGWSQLQLQKRNAELLVCEADYLRNPWADVREDITVAIQVNWGQAEFAKKLSVNAMPCTFSQEIQISAGIFQEPEALMRRVKSPKGNESGWFIGPADQEKLALVHERGDYDSVLTYQLLRLRPAMLTALILPIEFKALFRGDCLAAVLDTEDEVIYSA